MDARPKGTLILQVALKILLFFNSFGENMTWIMLALFIFTSIELVAYKAVWTFRLLCIELNLVHRNTGYSGHIQSAGRRDPIISIYIPLIDNVLTHC